MFAVKKVNNHQAKMLLLCIKTNRLKKSGKWNSDVISRYFQEEVNYQSLKESNRISFL